MKFMFPSLWFKNCAVLCQIAEVRDLYHSFWAIGYIDDGNDENWSSHECSMLCCYTFGDIHLWNTFVWSQWVP